MYIANFTNSTIFFDKSNGIFYKWLRMGHSHVARVHIFISAILLFKVVEIVSHFYSHLILDGPKVNEEKVTSRIKDAYT